MKSYIIHLIRHGLTQSNIEGRLAGHTDSPLTEEGRAALYELAPKYEKIHPVAVFSSPLSRSVETARILFPQHNPVVMDGFKEYYFGAWENRRVEEVVDVSEEVQWDAFLNGSMKIPEAESPKQFLTRITAAFDGVIQGMMKSGVTETAIVTHGGVIMTLMSLYAYPKAESPLDWNVDNGYGFTLRTNTALWTRDQVLEAIALLPPADETEDDGDYEDEDIAQYILDEEEEISEE